MKRTKAGDMNNSTASLTHWPTATELASLHGYKMIAPYDHDYTYGYSKGHNLEPLGDLPTQAFKDGWEDGTGDRWRETRELPDALVITHKNEEHYASDCRVLTWTTVYNDRVYSISKMVTRLALRENITFQMVEENAKRELLNLIRDDYLGER